MTLRTMAPRGALRCMLGASLGLGAGLLPACNATNRGQDMEQRPAASAVRDPVLEDIPKPAGFALVDDGTFGVFSGQVRIARCQYVGSTDRAAVKRFYEEYMPAAGFELRKWSLDNGVYILNFESATESCTVRLHPKEWGKTAVVVELQPRAQGPAEREAKPPLRRPQ